MLLKMCDALHHILVKDEYFFHCNALVADYFHNIIAILMQTYAAEAAYIVFAGK